MKQLTIFLAVILTLIIAPLSVIAQSSDISAEVQALLREVEMLQAEMGSVLSYTPTAPTVVASRAGCFGTTATNQIRITSSHTSDANRPIYFEVHRSSSTSFANWTSSGPTSPSLYIDAGIHINDNYQYAAKACNSTGCSSRGIGYAIGVYCPGGGGNGGGGGNTVGGDGASKGVVKIKRVGADGTVNSAP